MTHFAHFIRQRRQQLGKTQAQVAAACGITQGAITLIELGQRQMDLKHLVPLAQVLETNLADLSRLALEVRVPGFAAALGSIQ